MTKDQAIHQLQTAISELQNYAIVQAPIGRTTATEAITMLQELMEAIQNDQLDQRHAVTVDSSAALPPHRGWR